MQKLDIQQCFACGSRNRLHVHHKHYDNFMIEKDDDLALLCEDCHVRVHEFAKNSRLSVMAATSILYGF